MEPKAVAISRPRGQIKTVKGSRDWVGSGIVLRDSIFKAMTDAFTLHGGTPLDTPVFELKEILTEKYGEDAHLMYDLKDQGGEICSLRFDLTVPFARWLAMNSFSSVKRYQIAKVYRRDQPAIGRGRLREFYQCDFDIAGTYDPMIPDAEVLCVIAEVFDALELDVTIRINHRRILNGLFTVAGVPSEKVSPISSAVDKLDKMSWADVKREMVTDKGLPEEVADRIGELISRSGGLREILDLLKSDPRLVENEDLKAGIDDLELLNSYLEALDILDKISFDLSLARGLDYYTGLLFEVIHQSPSQLSTQLGNGLEISNSKSKSESKKEPVQVGSIAAGGRYDNLVGMFSRRSIPCVGVSFGVDRIFAILQSRREQKADLLTREVDLYIMASGSKDSNGMLLERMAIARQLWKAGIRTDFAAKVKPRYSLQSKGAKDALLTVELQEEEFAEGQVRLKAVSTGESASSVGDRGRLVSKLDLVAEVTKLLNKGSL